MISTDTGKVLDYGDEIMTVLGDMRVRVQAWNLNVLLKYGTEAGIMAWNTAFLMEIQRHTIQYGIFAGCVVTATSMNEWRNHHLIT